MHAFDDSLAAAVPWKGRLRKTDRRVFVELVAAAREMHDLGEIEAALLLIADALAHARERAP